MLVCIAWMDGMVRRTLDLRARDTHQQVGISFSSLRYILLSCPWNVFQEVEYNGLLAALLQKVCFLVLCFAALHLVGGLAQPLVCGLRMQLLEMCIDTG